jgi:hypothetical protein
MSVITGDLALLGNLPSNICPVFFYAASLSSRNSVVLVSSLSRVAMDNLTVAWYVTAPT